MGLRRKLTGFILGVIAIWGCVVFLLGSNHIFGEKLLSDRGLKPVLQHLSDIPRPLRPNLSANAPRENYILSTLQQRDYYFNKLRGERTIIGSPHDHFFKKLYENDPHKISELPREDYELLARQAFELVDLDGDGIVSNREYQAIQQTRFDLPPSCKLPSLPKQSRLVSLGIFRGTAIATATASSQDRVTSVVPVHIDTSVESVSLVLLSQTPVMWKFRGNISAIRDVIVNRFNKNETYQLANGVIGVPSDLVHFLNSECIAYYSYIHPLTWKGKKAKSSLEQIFGRTPDIMVGEFEPHSVHISAEGPTISSAAIEETIPNRNAPPGFDPELWSVFLRYYPRGIIDIDPNTVVSTEPVEPYIVLPNIAGLAQLVNEGKLIPVPGSIKIVKEIPRYPAELGAVNLILSTRVPFPKGQVGAACVWKEKSWELLLNSRNGRCLVATDLKRLAY